MPRVKLGGNDLTQLYHKLLLTKQYGCRGTEVFNFTDETFEL
jgi:hypothetical protein